MDLPTLLTHMKNSRPNLSESSLKSYKSILSSLYRQMKPNTDFDAHFFLNHPQDVLHHLRDVESSKRKTKLSALIVAVSSLNPEAKAWGEYKSVMMSDANKTDSFNKLQRRTPKQEENWIDWDDVLKFWEDMRKSTMPLWSKPRLTKDEIRQCQNFVILSVYTLIPPRRIADYINMKIRNADREKDNYIDKKYLVFNDFKTSKFYQTQKVEIPNSLRTILTKWMKVNLEGDYLIVDTNGRPMSQPQLSIRLNKIFGPTEKIISVNMLRHSYLTSQYKDIPSLARLEKTAEEMGHSVGEALLYIKK